jgi:hypothetical protein
MHSIIGKTFVLLAAFAAASAAKTCAISPLGAGNDDTDQVRCPSKITQPISLIRNKVLAAVEECGNNGNVVLNSGDYNITR